MTLWLLFFSSPKTFQLLLPFLWDHFRYHLCSGTLLLQLSLVSPFESFGSWLIIFFWYLPCSYYCLFLSLLPLITFPALKNFFGATIVKQVLNTDVFLPSAPQGNPVWKPNCSFQTITVSLQSMCLLIYGEKQVRSNHFSLTLLFFLIDCKSVD